MAKQEKSKFQLNKGSDHGFDISKGGKRKFDLTKDDEEPVENVNIKPQSPTDDTDTGTQAKKNRLWIIILAILAIILLLWWLLGGKTSNPESKSSEEATEEVVTPSVVTPSEDSGEASEEVETTIDEEATEADTDNDESSTPNQPVVNTPEVAPAEPSAPAPTAQSKNNVVDNNASSAVSNDIEVEALKVIRGDYGTGQERKNRLGNQYDAIQRRVNEMKREGVF